jgi:AcrR family transcriptional regulator
VSPAESAARARILEATIGLIGEVGLARTTTRRIAERAQTNGAQVNYYFGTKQALLREATTAAMMRVFEPAIRAMMETEDVALGVAEAARSLASPAADPGMLRLTVETMALYASDPPSREMLARTLGEVRAALAARLSGPGVAAGGVAAVIVALLDGLAFHLLMDPGLDVDGAAHALETMIRCIRHQGPR